MSAPIGSVALELDRQDAGAPRQQWIHLLPAPGLVQGRDGRAWRLGDLAQVIRASNSYAGGRGIPVDYEHQSEVAASNGQPAPAAGWIKELQSRADGLWGRVEWTRKAANHVQEREYRFVSPVFLYRQGEPGSITRLVSVGLTNGPNLLLKALNRARSGTAMNEMEELRELLGLDDEAGIPEVLQGVRGLVEGGKASNRPDPSKFVPMEIFRSTVAELNVRNQGMTEELALNHVEEQMSKGRLLPFLKDWAVDLCKRDRPAFDSFIGETGTSMNKLFSPLGLERRPPSGRQAKLSETEAQIARTLGHSEEEFIAANRSRSS